MCKILVFTNTQGMKISKLTQAIGPLLHASEKDGLGFAAVGKNGVFGQKTLTKNFLSYPLPGQSLAIDIPIIVKSREFFGQHGDLTGPAIFHGRTSTNGEGLVNCHPMQRDNWHLIHNGVVTDFGPNYKKNTDNDSEDLLYRYIEGIGSVEEHLSGYYAFAAIDPQNRLHVIRDNVASLYVAKIQEPQGYVFGTTDDLIKEVCKKLKLTHGAIEKYAPNQRCVFEGNALVEHMIIKPKGWTYKESQHAERSLHRPLLSGQGDIRTRRDALVDKSGKSTTDMQIDQNTIDEIRSIVAESEREVRELDSDDLLEAQGIWEDELRNMDDSYQFFDYDDKPLTYQEFRKLDRVSQELCTIIRPDGSIFDPEMEVANGNISARTRAERAK